MWYPCSEPPGEIDLGNITVPRVKDCPISSDKLPPVVDTGFYYYDKTNMDDPKIAPLLYN